MLQHNRSVPSLHRSAARTTALAKLFSSRAAPLTARTQSQQQEQHRRRAIGTATGRMSELQTTGLPALDSLDDDYERKHAFGNFASWLVPGAIMLGRYPYCMPGVPTKEVGEAQLNKIIEAGITTFVSLQAEVPPQAEMDVSGADGFLPYKAKAELIKSALNPSPSQEGLNNPTPEPPKFVQFPITDFGVSQDKQAFAAFINDLVQRITSKGEKLYIHCAGGRGRTGTVGACLVGKAYGLSADEALERVQRAISTRQGMTRQTSSPEPSQLAFVQGFLSS